MMMMMMMIIIIMIIMTMMLVVIMMRKRRRRSLGMEAGSIIQLVESVVSCAILQSHSCGQQQTQFYTTRSQSCIIYVQ